MAFLSARIRGNSYLQRKVFILPIVDFNGDGVVDIADVGIMIEHWYTDDSLCDIRPYLWGDGIVDAQDLKVLAKHMVKGRTGSIG
jgi:hypothetical protein